MQNNIPIPKKLLKNKKSQQNKKPYKFPDISREEWDKAWQELENHLYALKLIG